MNGGPIRAPAASTVDHSDQAGEEDAAKQTVEDVFAFLLGVAAKYEARERASAREQKERLHEQHETIERAHLRILVIPGKTNLAALQR